MPRRDNNEDLRELVRHAVKIWALKKLVHDLECQEKKLSAGQLGDILSQLACIDALVAVLDRPDLLKLAEKARREEISIPRKQRELCPEDGDLWFGVRARLAQGARSERDACGAEAVERGAKSKEDMIRARSQYRRTDKRVADITRTVGLDVDSIFKPCS
jgi:hypothetical protein